jgi:hypothetical protein
MKYTKLFLVVLACLSFSLAAFYIGEWNKPKASSEEQLSSQVSYKIINARQSSVWLSDKNNQKKRLLTGMIITTASTPKEYNQIAKQIKSKFESKNLDSIELTIHDPNDGIFEEDISYMPVSKGTIKIGYTSLGQEELHLPGNYNYHVETNQ